MTHEEILNQYPKWEIDVWEPPNNNRALRLLYRKDDALKAMAEAVEAAKVNWDEDKHKLLLSISNLHERHDAELAAKDKEIAELKGEIINALRKETGYSRERCVDALVKSSYNLHMAKDIAIKNHPKF